MWSSGSAKLAPLPAGCCRVAILQQLDDDVVELDEAHVQPLRAAAEVGNAQRPRIDLAHARLDVLVGQQRVVDALALEVAVAHHLGAAEHLGVEREGAVHVLHGEAEVLHALQPRAERAAGAGLEIPAGCGGRGCRRRRQNGGRETADDAGGSGLQEVAAGDVGTVGS